LVLGSAEFHLQWAIWDFSLGLEHDQLIFHLWTQNAQISAPTLSIRVRGVIFSHGGKILLSKSMLRFADSKA
jgi:hypothetical protein